MIVRKSQDVSQNVSGGKAVSHFVPIDCQEIRLECPAVTILIALEFGWNLARLVILFRARGMLVKM